MPRPSRLSSRAFIYILLTALLLSYFWIRRQRQQPAKGFQGTGSYELVIMGIFKNESMVLREWIEHYKWQGADHMLLLDNNSTDDWRTSIQGLEDFVTVLPAAKDFAQVEHYNTIGKAWLDEHGVDIVGILDVDEYVFPKDGRSLKEVVRERFSGEGAPSQIKMNWTMFGSSGHTAQPKDIRKSFTWRRRDLDENTKCFVRRAMVTHYTQHGCSVNGRTEDVNAILQLNHYAIMSKEYFQTVKMTRGDVASTQYLNVRNWDYFKRYDHKEIVDTALRDLLDAAAGAAGAAAPPA